MNMWNRYIFIMLVMAMLLNSCDSNNGYIPAIDFEYNMVTFVSDESGMNYEFQAYNDSPLIKLHDDDESTLNLSAGDRLMLQYIELGEESGVMQISTMGYSSVIDTPLARNSRDEIKELPNYPVNLSSIWRTGGYINLNCQFIYIDEPRNIQLFVNSDSENSEIVEFYLLDDAGNLQPSSYYRRSYASFDISSVWNRESCRGARVYIQDINNGMKSYDFTK